ncbi:MAG TPA: dsRBD fold-containing protein [Acidimicrobiales bacterium]|nr:dsRBD fold-containing protein [Acidimicrobiales bacterium]
MSHNHHRNHEPRNHESHNSETWRVEVRLERKDDKTVATADLFVGNAEYEAHGGVHAGELDAAVARELAVARALAGLAHQLVDDASRRVGRIAHAVGTATEDAADTYIVLHG